jgi:hypothetical protein
VGPSALEGRSALAEAEIRPAGRAREPDHRIEKELKELRRDSKEGLRGRTGIAGIGDLHHLIRVIPAQGNRPAGLFVA